METSETRKPSIVPIKGSHYNDIADFWGRAHRVFVYVSEPASGIDCGAAVPDAACKTCETTGKPLKTPSSCSYAAAMQDDSSTSQALHSSPTASSNASSNSIGGSSSASSCPVLVSDSGESLHPLTRMPMALYAENSTPTSTATPSPATQPNKRSWWSWSRSSPPSGPSQPLSTSTSTLATTSQATGTPDGSPKSQLPLNTKRQLSTIPMAKPPDGAPVPRHQQGVAEGEGGHRVWMYPSEQMFYQAMKRKGWQPEARDMNTVVNIHNAVNERAWHEVCAWESLHCAECPQGPRLARFQGRPADLSPRARFLNLLGYAPPFDRHDWVVDRCGKQVRYIIDFYAGIPPPGGPPAAMWLDTRPALDSFEAAWDRMTVSAKWVLGSMWPMGPTPSMSPHHNPGGRPHPSPST